AYPGGQVRDREAVRGAVEQYHAVRADPQLSMQGRPRVTSHVHLFSMRHSGPRHGFGRSGPYTQIHDRTRRQLAGHRHRTVHPDHRDGGVINLAWAGLARYLHLTGHRWLAGCASVALDDGGATAAGVWELALRKHLSPPEYRVLPHRPWVPVERPAGRVVVP